MNEVLQYLKDNPTFYIATVEGEVPRVRPFGFAMEFEGKLCMCTNNKKEIYKQLQANPNVEVSVASKTGDWLRIRGKAVFNTSRASKQAALEVAPFLASMYSVDDSIFEIFYLDDAEAIFSSMKGEVRSIRL